MNRILSRPVLAIVISVIITLVGLLGLFNLPVTQYPDIIPPSVIVTAKYPGANAEQCVKAVIILLERAINGVPGMTYMTSVAGNDGTSIIQVNFQTGTDPDIAAVNVQTRVTSVYEEMPPEVLRAGISVEKEVTSILMYINLLSSDPSADEKYVFNFADINIIPELKRIDGVGYAQIMALKDYAMRIWLKPEKMVAYNISASEVVDMLRKQNVNAAPGKIGESSDKRPQMLLYVLKYTGKFTRPEEYENIVLRADSTGSILRIKDIADVEFGAMDYTMLSKENGRPSAAIMIKQRPGSNAREVILNIKKRLEELKQTSFPPDIYYTITYDVSRFLDASIKEVIKTILEAFILVVLVVFIFLQDWRATLIPVLAVPVSLIGTFAFMHLMGFSINLITLFAMVLAIGIVVDNAIVVVEAVHARMEAYRMNAREATLGAMKDIGSAIVSITLVMSAVFIPVAFLSGPAGVFYRQFSITLAVAIVISGINALTLSPVMCIMLMDKKGQFSPESYVGKFFIRFNHFYHALSGKYERTLTNIVTRRNVIFLSLILLCVAAVGISSFLSVSFIPAEDQGAIYVNVSTPPGATVERTEKVLDQIQQIASSVKAVESVSTLAGYNLMTEGRGASYGMAMINLKPWHKRKESVDELIKILEEKTKNIADARIEFFSPPAIPGFGNASGFEFRLLDKTGSGDLQQMKTVSDAFLKALRARPEIDNVFTSFEPNFPQYLISIDQDAAAQKGVSIADITENLQILIGSYYATNFIRFNQLYKVMVQALPEYRATPSDILKLYVKNSYNEMVPLSSFVSIQRVYGVEQITRYNMYTAAMINGMPARGYSTGDAIRAIKEEARTHLPRGYSYEWSGMTREEVLAGRQGIFILFICLVFVYLILSAQYESFFLPFPVLLFLPAGIFGSFFFLMLLGLENNIYAQVAIVMLIGLLGKNAILVVEYAHMQRKQGKPVVQAAIEGASLRLRPILMTSFAFIAGLIPLVIASGAGAIGNRTIGTAAAGGMLIGTFAGIVLVPGLYVVFATLEEKIRKRGSNEQENNG